MSAIPGDVQLETEFTSSDERPRRVLPPTAVAYEIVIGVAALAVALPFLLRLNLHTRGWVTFAVLAAGASLTI